MYKGVYKILSSYWRAYGGWRALCRSPYAHAAVVMTLLSYPMWRAGSGWWDLVLSIMPNLLGFTLGGFAIFIGFGDEKFRTILIEETERDVLKGRVSIYEELCATFVHFIVMQILALVFALLQKAWSMEVIGNLAWQDALPKLNLVAGFVGYLLFFYAVCLTMAACMHVFRFARDYSTAINHNVRCRARLSAEQNRKIDAQSIT